jgi:RNA polymerase sigma-B factor
MPNNIDLSLKIKDLLIAYHRCPNLRLRNQLVQSNMGLVYHVAYRFSQQCAEPVEDLQQVGYLGLIRAIERFNPEQGASFSCFAIPYIRGEILHFLRDKGGLVKIPRRFAELQKKSQKIIQELTLSLGRNPKDQEIATALNISLKEWRDIKIAAMNRLPLSLDMTIGHTVDDTTTLGETLADNKITHLQSQQEDRLQLENALSQLENKTQMAIKCVFFQELSRKEAAQKLGVSPMTVSRNVQKGIEQLINLLQPQLVS